MKKIFFLVTILILSMSFSYGQKERKYIREGNDYYKKALGMKNHLDTEDYNKAEIAYRRAIALKPNDSKWNFNLADAMYKQKRFSEAEALFRRLGKTEKDRMSKARCYHNMGNSLLWQNKLDESIEAYKEALRLNPKDMETKYNLAYAQQKKKDQKKNQNKNQNKNKQNQNKNNQNKNQNKSNQNKQDQQSGGGGISKSNAESILDALNNDEKNNQQSRRIKATSNPPHHIDKNW